MYVETTNSATQFAIGCVCENCAFSMTATYQRQGKGRRMGLWQTHDFQVHTCSVTANLEARGRIVTLFRGKDLAMVLAGAFRVNDDRLYLEDQKTARRQLKTVTNGDLLDSMVRWNVALSVQCRYTNISAAISIV